MSKVEVLDTNGTWNNKRSGDLKVGDVVKVKQGKPAPADLVILYCEGKDSKCGIKTDQIDGETDTKIRRPIDET